MSILDRQEIEIPLNLGMSTKPSAELQDPSTMRIVENLHWRGAGDIEKVAADDVSHSIAVPSNSLYATEQACGLVLRESDPVVVTGSHGLMTYNEALSQAQWARRELTASASPTSDGALKYSPVSYDVSRRFVDRAQASKDQYGVFQVASAQYAGVQVIAWVIHGQTNYLRLKAIEADTGKVVATLEHIAMTGGTDHISACEYAEVGKEGVLIAYASASSFAPYTIHSVRYDHASRTFVMDSDLTTSAAGSGGVIRFVVRTRGTRFFLAFLSNSSGNMVVQDRTIGTVTTTHSASHAFFSGVDILPGPVRTLIVSTDTTNLYAEVFGSPGSYITVYTTADDTFFGCTAALETRNGNTHDAVVWVNCITGVAGEPDSSRVLSTEVSFTATLPTTTGFETWVPHAWCVSRGFTLQTRAHVALALGFYRLATVVTREAATCVVVRYAGHSTNSTRHDPVAKLCHDRFFLRADTQNLDIFTSTYTDSNDNAWLVLPADPSATPVDYGGVETYYPQTIFLARIDAKRPMPMPYASPEPSVVLVAGGAPWQFDGDTPAEAAPLMRPIIAIDAASGSGRVGTYSVAAMWKWIDAAGRLHKIASSIESTGFVADNQIDVYVARCPLTAYDGFTAPDMDVEVYITNGTTSELQLAITSIDTRQLYSSITANGLWFKFSNVDPNSGADNTGSGITDAIFTTEIAPEPVPAFHHVAKVIDRMWAIDAEDRGRIWYSKPMVAGMAVQWSVLCTLTIGDECTAVVDVQGGAVVLARGGVYLVSGAGPDATIASLTDGSFAPAVKLSNEVDCVDPVSVCRTPLGVVFRGRRGFYLLVGTQAQPFGVPIDPEVLTDPSLDPGSTTFYRMRAAWQEQTNEIHVLAPAARYIYNLLEEKWSRSVITSTLTADTVVARGKLWRLDRVNGTSDRLRSEKLFAEDGASYNSDAATTWAIETPWLKPDQVGGHVRLWRAWLSLALPSAPGDINYVSVEYFTDYNESAGQEASWLGSDLAALYTAGERVVELPFYPSQQLCKAFKFRLNYSYSAAPSSGAKPLSLRMRYGIRGSKGKRLRAEVK